MSQLTYAGIELDVIHTNQFIKRPQFTQDGSTYLYTRYDLECTCIFNPAVTSYHLPGSVAFGLQRYGDGAPQKEPGKLAGITEASLQHYLSRPRQQLEYRVNGAILLSSPPDKRMADAANGPFVEDCRVRKMHGERTFEVDLKFVTYLKVCEGTNPIIAHRWKRWVEIDQDYFTQVITEGEATFRADLLIAIGAWPDMYRSEIFHPIPTGFKRENITVIPNEAGTALAYRYIDRELPMKYTTRGHITRCEAYMTGSWARTGARTAAALNSAGLMSTAGAAIIGPGGGGGIPFLTSAINQLQNINAMRTPRYSVNFLVRLWGTRLSNRGSLTRTAMSLIAARFTARDLFQEELVITHDLAGKFVEVQKTISWGIEQIVKAPASGTGLGFLRSIIPNFDAIPGRGDGALIQLFVGSADQSSDAVGTYIHFNRIPDNGAPLPFSTIGPPRDSNSRGTWIGKLVAQGLHDACEEPPVPPPQKNMALPPATLNHLGVD